MTERICEEFYQSMLQDFGHCRKKQLPLIDEIECCFQICTKYWSQLKIEVSKYEFKSDADEINFFKNCKPKFTSEIEYYNLLYHAEIFKPDIDIVELRKFWVKEGLRLKKFINEHEEFYSYYKNEDAYKDTLYFVRANSDYSNFSETRLHDMLVKACTSHDYLVSGIIAQERYNAYVDARLKELDRVNSEF